MKQNTNALSFLTGSFFDILSKTQQNTLNSLFKHIDLTNIEEVKSIVRSFKNMYSLDLGEVESGRFINKAVDKYSYSGMLNDVAKSLKYKNFHEMKSLNNINKKSNLFIDKVKYPGGKLIRTKDKEFLISHFLLEYSKVLKSIISDRAKKRILLIINTDSDTLNLLNEYINNRYPYIGKKGGVINNIKLIKETLTPSVYIVNMDIKKMKEINPLTEAILSYRDWVKYGGEGVLPTHAICLNTLDEMRIDELTELYNVGGGVGLNHVMLTVPFRGVSASSGEEDIKNYFYHVYVDEKENERPIIIESSQRSLKKDL